MTDSEITKRCADMMGIRGHAVSDGQEMWSPVGYDKIKDAIVTHNGEWRLWNPLHDGAQAMALVESFHIDISSFLGKDGWRVWQCRHDKDVAWTDPYHNVNRAICECVAEMQKEKP